jgi:hypothetical protein
VHQEDISCLGVEVVFDGFAQAIVRVFHGEEQFIEVYREFSQRRIRLAGWLIISRCHWGWLCFGVIFRFKLWAALLLEGEKTGAWTFRISADAPVVTPLALQGDEIPAALGAIRARLGGVTDAFTMGSEVCGQLAAQRPKGVVEFAHIRLFI